MDNNEEKSPVLDFKFDWQTVLCIIAILFIILVPNRVKERYASMIVQPIKSTVVHLSMSDGRG